MILSGKMLEDFKQEAIKRGLMVGKITKIGKKKAIVTEVSKNLFVCGYGNYKEYFSFVDAILNKYIKVGG